MARKDNSPAISFFSFQDIITSITGIMFLVVLILVLLVVTRSQSSPAVKVKNDAAKLMQTLKELQRQVAAQAAGSQKLQQRLEELKKLDAASLPRRKEELLQKIRQSTILLEQENRTVSELERERQKLETQLKARNEEKKTLQRGNGELERLLTEQSAERKKLQLELAKNAKLVRFVWDREINKTPVLAICSGKGITAQDARNGKVLYSGRNDGDVPAMLQQFVSWSRGAGNIYVVLLAKPSGLECLEPLSSLLEQAGIERGREVLPSEEDILPGGKP